MKIITKTINSESQNNKGSKKHLVYFFGLGESIKGNNEDNDFGQWIHNKNIDIHMLNYHYSENNYPEHFHNVKFKLKRALITTIVASALGFIGYSIIASKMPVSLKVPIFITFLIPAIITAAIVIFYPYTVPLLKFATRGNDPVKTGMAKVIDLLEKGVRPDDIILMGNSLGGGIAAEVLKKFEEENVYFTFIHSNSYDSWKDVPRSQKSSVGTFFKRISIIVDIWFKICHLNYKPNEIIKSTKAPVLATNRVGDTVIDEAAQSVPSLRKFKNDFKDNKDLKVTALLKSGSYNPHVQPLIEMVVDNIDYLCSQNIPSINDSKTYEELLENFIDEAHKYLAEEKLNEGFNLGNFKQNKLYQEMQKNRVSLIDINDVPNCNLTIDYCKY
ncbi:MAG: hypothetical protein sL5_07680 [Candidatus Mesenet longicola]|uniref:Alpha/beta hydrolase n=1 Tax=Candidatus Mesenet longicola TaxID=1892558 RepID=A0A8J3HVA4_9RICK|nr:MAG: hypothetical protein sGL2_08230 [Candidatus Mesenet longicola]GHM59775.1 MAG: hypothetical protein sL5_07680 [Candidatus Mesenet longicola]